MEGVNTNAQNIDMEDSRPGLIVRDLFLDFLQTYVTQGVLATLYIMGD